MIDNSRVPELTRQGLRCLAYEQQVKIWDMNCSDCPFSTVKTIVNRRPIEHKNLKEAIDRITLYGDETAQMIRGCCYGGDELSLFEIVTNTCRLWKSETLESEEGIFEEITEFPSPILWQPEYLARPVEEI